MHPAEWRTAYASVIGTSHLKNGAPCQDSSGYRIVKAADGGDIWLGAASDGAGSAEMSQDGSSLAVAHFLDWFGDLMMGEDAFLKLDQSAVENWLLRVNSEIETLSSKNGRVPRDYACTFLAAIVGAKDAIYFQVGDGAVVAAGEEEGIYDWVFWPQHGEFANQTNFITMEGVERVLEYLSVPCCIREVALFTDGIERLVLNLKEKKVHSPALRPIFEWLATTDPVTSTGMSSVLGTYLSSEHINSRTDDDKTLVMATRVDRVAQTAQVASDT